MAESIWSVTGMVPSRRPHWPSLLAVAGLVLFIGGALAGLLSVGLLSTGLTALVTAFGAFDPYLARVAGFTLWQASLSTLLSLIPAIIVARALSRHRVFFGRAALIRLFALPLALPALIAALGLLALLGRAGIAAPALSALTGTRWPGIYGLGGIVLAHVFFNLPLATRFLLAALEAIDADQWRLARQLGFSPLATFRLVEWPAIRAALPGVGLTIFLLCATSFTLVLLLGGGPQATTIEVAVYQALRFDFDPPRAAALALLQLGFVVLLAVALARIAEPEPGRAGSGARVVQPRVGLFETMLHGLALALAALLVALPIAAIVLRGLAADLGGLLAEPGVWRAALTSLAVAVPAALLGLTLSIALLSAQAGAIRHFASRGGGLLLSVSPVVLGAGWFLALQSGLFGRVDPFAAAPVLVVAANAVMATPFVLRMLAPGWADSRARHDRLCASLGLAGLTRLRLVEGRALARPILAALALAATLSIGDLGVIALFGSDGLQTLPALLHARLGSYRTDDAAGLALIIAIVCLGLLWLSDRLAGKTA